MAFHKLPPVEDFIAARLSKEFTHRSAFEAKADAMFAAFLAKNRLLSETLVEEHEKNV